MELHNEQLRSRPTHNTSSKSTIHYQLKSNSNLESNLLSCEKIMTEPLEIDEGYNPQKTKSCPVPVKCCGNKLMLLEVDDATGFQCVS